MSTDTEKLKALATALVDVISEEDEKLDSIQHIKFANPIAGKGLLWTGKDYTKQFVFQDDNLFSSENINIAKGKNVKIDDQVVLSNDTLGNSVTKSNLKEVGTLKGLIVDGGMSINNYLIFDANSDRLGIGTEEPNAALSVAEDGIEVMVGTEDFVKGFVGTFASHDLELKTDNTTRVAIKAGGDIELGNPNASPVKISVNGKLAVGVNNPDSDVDLHVRGAIKFNNNKHLSGTTPPTGGQFNQGDIMWNSNPTSGRFVGWVCVKAGGPGLWTTFGPIT